MASKSRSRSNKRNYSPRSSVDGKKFLEQTYNSEYKKTPKTGQQGVSQIRKDKTIQASDFSVCPKYLQTATDLDDLTSVHTEAKKFPERGRTDSSEKKRHLERTYAEDRLDFIHNYNELVVKNKTLAREVARLKLHLGLDADHGTRETANTVHGKGSLEESKGRLSVQPQQTPVLDGPSDFRHLSPIAGDKVHYSTPPDFNESKRKQGGQHSTINFNLTSSVKKDQSGECCYHETQAKQLAFEVEKLEKMMKNNDQNNQIYKSNLTPSKKVAFHEAIMNQEDPLMLKSKISALENELSVVRRQLETANESIQKLKFESEKKEEALRTDIALLTKEKVALSEDKVKLLTDLNKLKYESPTDKSKGQGELIRKLAETEALIQKMTLEAESSAEEKHQLHGKLVKKEEELKRSLEIQRQHEDTIFKLQAELDQLASSNKITKNQIFNQGFTGSGDQSPSKLVGDLKIKLEEVTKQRDTLHAENDELKATIASIGGPIRLKRHPKSFHQIARQGADPKQNGMTQAKKGSTRSEHEEEQKLNEEAELSIVDENEKKSEGAELSISARIKSSQKFDCRDCR